MKYKKIKDGEGDFNSFNAVKLHEALIELLGDQDGKWDLSTNQNSITINVNVEGLDLTGVDKVFEDHFKIDWTDYDPKKDKKDKLRVKLSQVTTIAGLKTFIEEELLQ